MRAQWLAIVGVAFGCGNGASAEQSRPAPAAPVVPVAPVAPVAPAPAPSSAPDPAATATSCVCPEPDDAVPPPAHDTLTLTKVKWSELPGWSDDKHGEAIGSFLRSCAKIDKLRDDAPVGHDGHGGKARQWRKACAAAAKLQAKPDDHAAAKAMFEAEFVPYMAAGKAGPQGKMTGYYVQEMRGSRKPSARFKYPVHDRPKDLVMIDLSKHIRDGHGRRIWGKHVNGEVVPYATRAEIRKGALAGQGLEVLYVDDAVDLLFAHIEGSAKVVMDDKSVVWLEFSGKNGRAYKGVGGVLKGMGALSAPGSGTMPGIRKWFVDNPGRFDEVVDQVHSYVFFKPSKVAGAMGSQDVVLTAQRSMAIDRAFVAHGTPIWVETRAPIPGKPGTEVWRKLLVAQDTGGGIKGAVRGDIYWGDDAVAADLGGRMGGAGRYWLLLPKGVTK